MAPAAVLRRRTEKTPRKYKLFWPILPGGTEPPGLRDMRMIEPRLRNAIDRHPTLASLFAFCLMPTMFPKDEIADGAPTLLCVG